jgi:RNA polymerase sigma-70 factor (ECF subfamily)
MKGRDDCPYRRHAGSPGSTGTSLINGLRSNQPQSWERLIRDYAPLVFRWALTAGLHPEDAVGVGQEVFQAIAEGFDSFRRDSEGQSLRAWVWQITHNRAVDFHRKYGKEPRAIGGDEGQDYMEKWIVEVAEENNSSGIGAAVELVIGVVRAEFEPRTWRAFEQTVMEDRPASDVAAELRMSVGAVYVARSKVQKRLREVLAKLTSDDIG